MPTYSTENYYFKDKNFNFAHALKVTAQTIGEWCDWYEAVLIAPTDKVKITEKQGMLPKKLEEKKKFIGDVIVWILDNSSSQELFKLYLDSNPIQNHHKFQHHDDTCCWYLNLTKQEFQKLQNAWQENNLPMDLFYPQDKAIRILKPLGWFGKFMTSWGWTRESFEIYTPKDWEETLKIHPEWIDKLSRNTPLEE